MQQDNHHNFDNFTRKVLSEEHTVPAGFEWENMDIEIPKKKKRFPFFIPILGTIIIIIAFIAGYFIRDFVKSDNSRLISEQSNPQLIVDNNVNENSSATSEFYDHKSNTQINQSDTNFQVAKNSETVNNTTPLTKNSDTQQTSNTVSNKSQNETIDAKISDNINTRNFKNKQVQLNQNAIVYQPTRDIGNGIGIVNRIVTNPSISELSNTGILANDAQDEAKDESITTPRERIKTIDLANDNVIVYEMLMPSLTLREQTINIDNNQSIDIPKNEIVLIAGANINQLKFSADNILDGKIGDVLGQSFGIRYQKEMSSYLFWNTNIQYDEYHTVFTHNREVSRVNNYTSGLRTITTEQIYHNNYSKAISLNSGLSLRKSLSNRIALQGNLAIGATYLMSQSGKTLFQDDVIALEDIDLDQGINVNIQPSLDLRYHINNRVGIQLTYANRYSLANSIQVNQKVESTSMHQFLTGISMKF